MTNKLGLRLGVGEKVYILALTRQELEEVFADNNFVARLASLVCQHLGVSAEKALETKFLGFVDASN